MQQKMWTASDYAFYKLNPWIYEIKFTFFWQMGPKWNGPIFHLLYSYSEYWLIDGCAIRLALALEEVKFLQKQREKKSGIPALPIPAPSVAASGVASNSSAGGLVHKVNDKSEGDGEKDDLVLQDTFAQETAVMVEDPNMYAIPPSVLFVFTKCEFLQGSRL